MKRFLFFAFAFVGCISFSFAGIHGKTMSEFIRKNRANAFLPLNPSDVRYNWDTAVLSDTAGPADKYTRQLDGRGKVLSELNYVMESGIWVFSSRVGYTYDNQGKQVAGTHDRWVNGAWVPVTRDTMTYDASGNLTEVFVQLWQSGGWVNDVRFFSSYDAGGDTLSEGYYFWDNGAWAGGYRLTYTRNEQGRTLTELWEDWENGGWSNGGFVTRTYDALGRLLVTFGQSWQNGIWVNSNISTCTYDNLSRLLIQINESWDEVNLQWMNTQRQSLSYDADGNLIAVISESWDTTGQDWANFYRFRYTCDGNGNSTEGIREVWKSGSWSPGMSSLNVYSQKELVYTFWWPFRYQYHATFKSFTSGVDEKGNNMVLSVYPNPADEKLSIACKNFKAGQQVTVYDIQGRPVLQFSLSAAKTELDVSRLAPGNYIIRVGSATETGSALFVKK